MNDVNSYLWDNQVQLGTPEVYRLSQESWPRFLLEESDRPDSLLKFQITAKEFAERFRAYGIRDAATGKLIAFIQAVLVQVDLTSPFLPPLGWRFSIQNASMASPKNCASLTEACVDPVFRGKGLAKILIDGARQEIKELGFETVIAPVRPTGKVAFVNESMSAYCQRKQDDGRFFDSWLRTHADAGAKLVSICEDSVLVEAGLDKWRDWTGLTLNENGFFQITGGLMPLEVNLAQHIGIYREPNVWMRY